MRDLIKKMDFPLLIMTILYVIIGLVMIYSASSVTAVVRYGYEPYHFFIRQAIFIIAGLIVGFFFIIILPTRRYEGLSWPLLFLLIASLAFLFINGKVTNNAISWYDFKFFKVQPSEFAKSILIVFFATFYNNLYYNKKRRDNISNYFIPLAFAVIVTGLVYMQPDLGSATIIAGIAFLIFISIPVKKNKIMTYTKIFCVSIVAIAGILILTDHAFFLNENQKSRLKFQNPCSRYTEESGYQVCNGFIAINNGGLFGVGLGNSTQKYLYLPEAHTDFIFPIVVEELGLIPSILIILGYVYILWRILKIAKSSENLRCSILAYGTFCYLGLHILVNLLGVLALMPLTGVPLPLLSYGGSFTINALVMLFVVQRVNIENKINKANRLAKSL